MSTGAHTGPCPSSIVVGSPTSARGGMPKSQLLRSPVATGQPLPVPLPFPAWRRPLPISPSRGLSDHLGDMRVSIWSGHALCMPRDSQPEVEPAAAAVLRPMGARGGGRGPRQGPGERAPRGHAGAARCPAAEQTPACSPGSEKEGRGSLPDSSPRREPAPPSPGGAAWPGGRPGCMPEPWNGGAEAGRGLPMPASGSGLPHTLRVPRHANSRRAHVATWGAEARLRGAEVLMWREHRNRRDISLLPARPCPHRTHFPRSGPSKVTLGATCPVLSAEAPAAASTPPPPKDSLPSPGAAGRGGVPGWEKGPGSLMSRMDGPPSRTRLPDSSLPQGLGRPGDMEKEGSRYPDPWNCPGSHSSRRQPCPHLAERARGCGAGGSDTHQWHLLALTPWRPSP